MILAKPSQYHQHSSTQSFRHSIACFREDFVSVNYLNEYVQLQERADSVHVACKAIHIFKRSQVPAVMLASATSCTNITHVISLHMPKCLDVRLGAPAHATRRVRAGVWVLGHISRSFVRAIRAIRAIRIHFTGFRLWHNISAPLPVPHLLRVVAGEALRRFRAAQEHPGLAGDQG